jgi:hypothetical protein
MRQIRVSRIDVSRDPGVPGAVWYSGTGSINEPTPEPAPMTIDAYYEVLPEPPVPELSARDRLWKAAVECADEANAILRAEPDFDYMALIDAIENMTIIKEPPTASDIVAAYRQRLEARRNG